jgi:hypothetical protein
MGIHLQYSFVSNHLQLVFIYTPTIYSWHSISQISSFHLHFPFFNVLPPSTLVLGTFVNLFSLITSVGYCSFSSYCSKLTICIRDWLSIERYQIDWNYFQSLQRHHCGDSSSFPEPSSKWLDWKKALRGTIVVVISGNQRRYSNLRSIA